MCPQYNMKRKIFEVITRLINVLRFKHGMHTSTLNYRNLQSIPSENG